jgi:hypothetical protein
MSVDSMVSGVLAADSNTEAPSRVCCAAKITLVSLAVAAKKHCSFALLLNAHSSR